MRLSVRPLIALSAALTLAACGVSTTHSGFNPHPTGAISTFSKTSYSQPVANVPAVSAACQGLPALGSSTADATRLKSRIDSAIAAISKYVAANHGPFNPKKAADRAKLVARTRALSVAQVLTQASRALGRYLTSPSSSSRQAAVSAIQLEHSTAVAENLPACAIAS